ncbi:MAG: NUDIX hydrolase [Verrucomicrobia bacterium]|nr:NUDIX hydrolase [Verrucomicrobiota bacterium]
MGKNAEGQEQREKKARIDQEWIYNGPYVKLRRDVIFENDRPPKTWEIIVHPGAVAVLPINKDGNIVLIEQWRRSTNRILIEIPAGLFEPGESAAECAQRELQEEIGYRARTIKPLGGIFVAPGLSSEYVHLFVGTDLEESRLQADDSDLIDLKIVTPKAAKQMIEDGTICDAKTITAILRYFS